MPDKHLARTFAGAACPWLGAALALGVLVLPGTFSSTTILAAFVVLLLGFVGTQVSADLLHPLRPLQLTVASGMLVGVVVLGITLPRWRTLADLWPVVIVATGVVFPLTGLYQASKRPSLSAWLFMVPAAGGVFTLGSFVSDRWGMPPLASAGYPGYVYWLLLAGFLSASWIVAAYLAFRLSRSSGRHRAGAT